MRITFVIYGLRFGGAERVLTRLANHWTTLGHDVTVVTLATGPAHFPLHPGVSRVAVGVEPGRGLAGKARNQVRLVRSLRRAIGRSTPDVVIGFVDRTNVRVLLATRGMATPVIVREAVDPRHREGLPMVDRVARRLLYPRADAVVVHTQSVARWAKRFVPTERVLVIPNPAPPPSGLELDRASRPTRVIAVGRLVHQKGFDVLLRAFRRIEGAFPDWSIELVGDGPLRPQLERLAGELAITERVRFVGVVDEPMSRMRDAALMAAPSRYEGFPNVILEAMVCGLPVVATDCESGPRDMIRDGVDGFLVPVGDEGQLAERLAMLMGSPPLRRRMGSAAAERARAFDIERVSARWFACFAVAQRRGPVR